LNVHVEDPEPPGMLEGLQLASSPVEGVTEVVSVTVPENPLRPVTVIVDMAATPTLVDTLEGLAVMVKSWTWYLILVV
jgi:hypothetical protein